MSTIHPKADWMNRTQTSRDSLNDGVKDRVEPCPDCGEKFQIRIFRYYDRIGEEGCPNCNKLDELVY